MKMEALKVKTKQKKEVVDITNRVNELLKDNNDDNDDDRRGLVNILVTHTTAALTTADLDPGGTDLDYLEAFEQLVPKLNFRHPHDPSHMPDHVLSSLIGTSLTLPVQKGKLVLGTWQRLVLFEFDGPRERQIMVSFL